MQPQKTPQPETLKVRVLRSFQDHQRKVRERNETVELPRFFALEMKAANKVAIIEESAPAAPVPTKEEKSSFSGRKEK